MNTVLEYLYAGQELYSALLGPIRSQYKLTSTEMLVLLFLANNREYDTARDIVETLKLAKSHVSVSVRALEERGYIQGRYEGSNRRTIHLRLCAPSAEIIADAQKVQARFLAILEQGFSEEERACFKQYLQKVTGNINAYLKECAASAVG